VSDCGKVLVIDGDREMRRVIAELLARVGFETISADSGEAALAAVDSTRPALAVIEVELPGMSGLAVLETLHDRFGEDVPVILLSAEHGSALDRAAGLMLGADDYLAKPADLTELSARIRRSLRRSGSLETRNHRSRRRAADPGLSPREHEILAMLADGLSQPEIAQQLVISSKTVATHIQRILAKLGAHSRTQALAHAYRLGLVAVA
jgi:DNA-binding NarL/FixJ family response regulator